MRQKCSQVVFGVMLGLSVATHAFAQPSPPSLELPALPPLAAPTTNDADPSATALPVMPKVTSPPFAPVGNSGIPAVTPQADIVEKIPVAPETVSTFSFGTSNVSMLFTPSQIGQMKEAIIAFESLNGDAKPVIVVPLEPVAQQPASIINEPPDYPVFFLSTIAYEKPDDWSIWVAGYKITSRKNDTDLTIINVSRDSVTFTWLPEYKDAMTRRQRGNLYADTASVKNKLATSQRLIRDNITGEVSFTLRQNQSFSVGYFSIFEGYMESPKLLPLPLQDPNQLGSAAFDPQGNSISIDPNLSPHMQDEPNIPDGMRPEATGNPTMPNLKVPPQRVPPNQQSASQPSQPQPRPAQPPASPAPGP